MRHVCSRGCCLFHGDSGTSRITADQVRPATPANHRLLSNNPTYRCLVNPRIKKRSLPRVLIRSYVYLQTLQLEFVNVSYLQTCKKTLLQFLMPHTIMQSTDPHACRDQAYVHILQVAFDHSNVIRN